MVWNAGTCKVKDLASLYMILKYQIDEDKAGLAIGDFIFDAMRCKVGACLEYSYAPMYIWSKYPGKVAPMWNLTSLFSPLIWAYTFGSISIMICFLLFSSKVYSMMGLKRDLTTQELVLIPIR